MTIRDELLEDLGRVREEVAAYFAALPLEEAFRYPASGWAPVDDLRHLILSVEKVTQAFLAPAEAFRAACVERWRVATRVFDEAFAHGCHHLRVAERRLGRGDPR